MPRITAPSDGFSSRVSGFHWPLFVSKKNRRYSDDHRAPLTAEPGFLQVLLFLLIVNDFVFAMQVIEGVAFGDPLFKAPIKINYIRITHVLQSESS